MWTTPRFPASWLLPALLPVALMTIYPIGYALWTSLHSVLLLFPDTPFVGIENYVRVVTSGYFLDALYNSLVFTVIAAPLVVRARHPDGLVPPAEILRLPDRPVDRPPAVGFAGSDQRRAVDLGIPPELRRAQRRASRIGVIDGSIPWLISPKLALISVVVAHVWTQIPFAVVLTMAALSAINSETLEAAAIDCRSPVRRFRYVIFPEIKPMIVVLLIYNALTAFTTYDLVYAMTGGGPGTATTLLSFQIWKESFSMYDFGAGSAVAFIVVAISAVMILAITRALPSDLFEGD